MESEGQGHVLHQGAGAALQTHCPQSANATNRTVSHILDVALGAGEESHVLHPEGQIR